VPRSLRELKSSVGDEVGWVTYDGGWYINFQWIDDNDDNVYQIHIAENII